MRKFLPTLKEILSSLLFRSSIIPFDTALTESLSSRPMTCKFNKFAFDGLLNPILVNRLESFLLVHHFKMCTVYTVPIFEAQHHHVVYLTFF